MRRADVQLPAELFLRGVCKAEVPCQQQRLPDGQVVFFARLNKLLQVVVIVFQPLTAVAFLFHALAVTVVQQNVGTDALRRESENAVRVLFRTHPHMVEGNEGPKPRFRAHQFAGADDARILLVRVGFVPNKAIERRGIILVIGIRCFEIGNVLPFALVQEHAQGDAVIVHDAGHFQLLAAAEHLVHIGKPFRDLVFGRHIQIAAHVFHQIHHFLALQVGGDVIPETDLIAVDVKFFHVCPRNSAGGYRPRTNTVIYCMTTQAPDSLQASVVKMSLNVFSLFFHADVPLTTPQSA